VVIAYLMKLLKMPLQDAYTYVHKQRPVIQPNPSFLVQLTKYHNTLFPDAQFEDSDGCLSFMAARVREHLMIGETEYTDEQIIKAGKQHNWELYKVYTALYPPPTKNT